jgi:hypothetical protein
MTNRTGSFVILALVTSAAACSSSPSSSPSASPSSTSSQVLRGNVAVTAYALDNPVVVAHAADGRVFFAPIFADGSFAVTVPGGAAVRLSIANTTRSEGYVAISRILWPGSAAVWARLDGATASVELGNVRPAVGESAQILDHGGSSGSAEDRDGSSEHAEDAGEKGDAHEAREDGGDDRGGGAIHACGTPPKGRADLPYDMRPGLGSTFRLSDAFLAKGPAPAAITDVTMDGGGWRLAELRSDAPFVVTDADCTHAGNRDVGRDRVVVTWKNADGSTDSDHLDLRYCDGSADTAPSGGNGGAGVTGLSPDDCEGHGTPVCRTAGEHDSKCDGAGGGAGRDDDDHGDDSVCADGGAGEDGGGTTPGSGDHTGAAGDACTTSADCADPLVCIASRCTPFP